MAYIKGKGYMKFNNRWFGYPVIEDGQIITGGCVNIDYEGTRYDIAPQYDISGFPTKSFTSDPFTNIKWRGIYKRYSSSAGQEVIIDEVAELQLEPDFCPSATGLTIDTGFTIYRPDGTTYAPSIPSQEPIVNRAFSLLKPTVKIYAIYCDKTGADGYNEYRSPFSDVYSRIDMDAQWNSKFGANFPLDIHCRIPNNAINYVPPSSIPNGSFNSTSRGNVDYNQRWRTITGMYYSNPNLKYSNVWNEDASNNYSPNNGDNINHITTGVMMDDDSGNYRAARQFQCIYDDIDYGCSGSISQYQFWGIVGVITKLDPAMMTLQK